MKKKIWGIHAKDDNLFFKDNLIAIGWHKMGDLSKIEANRDAFKGKYTATYPDAKKGSIATGAGMLYRFCYEPLNMSIRRFTFRWIVSGVRWLIEN